MAAPVDIFFLDPDAQGTLQTQIQQMIAEAILSGRLARNEKLPSTRRLAAHLGVSRITVTLAYTELQSNDYLSSKGRSGFYVSENAPDPPSFRPTQRSEDAVDWQRAIGTRFTGGHSPRKPQDWRDYKYRFIYGQADPSLFDHNAWRLCALRALGQKDHATMMGDLYDQDDPQLVEFIVRHILPRRGIHARPEEILVTMGAQNALWISAQVLLTQRRKAVIENPCYYAIRDILAQSRCHTVQIQVDSDGLPPSAIPDGADVIFTTPSHQSPTTATMPLARRKALLKRAQKLDALVVEDDYDFEMSFLKPPSPALKSLDKDGRVIYIGSFSKSLFPGLRLGFLVGSEPFIREARALRLTTLRHPPGVIQRMIAYFLSLGHYDTLIKRIGNAYHERRQVMETAISEFGLTIAGRGAFGGSAFWMRAPEGLDTANLATALRNESVLIEPGAPFFETPTRPNSHYRVAYSSIASADISEGISRIANSINQQISHKT